jgi:glutathione synthase/RimK-type ligase-like ATP-grasp enzyme
MAFSAVGADVFALCPVGNPLRALQDVKATYTYSSMAPLRALTRAIRLVEPDLIIPTDDRTVANMHALHAATSRSDEPQIREVIELSLGHPDSFAISGTRHHLLEIMRQEHVEVPLGAALTSVEDVRAWCRTCEGPWVLKAEGSWGGSGVMLVHSVAAAEAAFVEMSRPLAFHKALRILLVDRDPFPFVQFLRRERRNVMAQAYVSGSQATIMAACWEGHILGTIGASVLSSQGRSGAATILRLIDSPRMQTVAELVAHRLRLSGFFGLDFIIDQSDGRYCLIELNPRATQLGHIRRGGSDLASLLFAKIAREPTPSTVTPDHGPVVALFPQALRFNSGATEKYAATLDVPWSEPQLIRELLRLPWTKRSPLARLEALMRRNDAFGVAPDPHKAAEIISAIESARTGPEVVDYNSTPRRHGQSIVKRRLAGRAEQDPRWPDAPLP